MAAEARLRRGARLLRADRAGLRLRRGGARHARRARRRRLGAHRLEDRSSRSARGRRSRSSSRAPASDGPRGHHVLRRPDRRGRLRARVRSRASSACARRTPPSCRSTACAFPTRTGSASSTAASSVAMSALDVGRISLGGRLRRHRAGLPRRVGRATRASAAQFGRPIAGFQLVQELLADIAVETDAARLLAWRAAALADRARAAHARVVAWRSCYASEVAVRAANNAVQVSRRLRLRRRVPGRQVPARRARRRRSTRARARSRS